jgi:histidinol dehydrogenase
MAKMKIVKFPDREAWTELLKRPESNSDNLEQVCEAVFEEVKKSGDEALREYTLRFDQVNLKHFAVEESEFEEAEQAVAPELKAAIRLAKQNIERFHTLQLPGKCEYVSEQGFRCWQEARPIERVGLYIPGGSAPLFSTVLMLAIPARLAGCKEVILCTPPDLEGKVHPAILWSARQCGVTKIFKVGGAQAIAAMTFGTETIGRVDKIFGPGNSYVTAAKQKALSLGIAIDMPAGPSELMVVADETASPVFVAADLLSQAEHGPDSQVFLVTCQESFPEEVEKEIDRQLNELPRKAVAEKALSHSTCIVLRNREECLEVINRYAPEHLIVSVKDYETWIPGIHHAGSVFLGNYSPESAGDYASGTNHTLPTGGYARVYSGIGVDSFMKKISFQEITSQGLDYLSTAIEVMAENEGLIAHRNAVRNRR